MYTIVGLTKKKIVFILRASPREKGKLRRFISNLPSQKGNYIFLKSNVLKGKKVNQKGN